MVRKKKNRPLELLKDLLIVLLVLSAVYLTLRTQLAAGLSTVEGGFMSQIIRFFDRGGGENLPANGQKKDQPVELRPLRMAVNIRKGERYGVQYDDAGTDKLFETMFSLLGEALGSAEPPKKVTEAAWRKALSDQAGVYFDFQGQVPMGALYAWLEAGPTETLQGESTRRILIAEDNSGGVKLYFERDGAYYASDTVQTPKGHLQSTVAAYSPNGAIFAYEYKGEGELKTLNPYVMLIQNAPSAAERTYETYATFNPLAQMESGREALLQALDFHPQSSSSYIAWGQLVVKEGADTLTVNDSGLTGFMDGGGEQARYPVGAGALPTQAEIMSVTQRIAEKTLGAWCGAAKLYLIGITPLREGEWQVDYGYRLDGVTVQLGSEGYAARFLVREGRVSEYTLKFRGYNDSGEKSTVLPELQAAAAMDALGADGRELLLTYEDNGKAETLGCGWIAQREQEGIINN